MLVTQTPGWQFPWATSAQLDTAEFMGNYHQWCISCNSWEPTVAYRELIMNGQTGLIPYRWEMEPVSLIIGFNTRNVCCVGIPTPRAWPAEILSAAEDFGEAKPKGLGFQHSTHKRVLKPIIARYYSANFVHEKTCETHARRGGHRSVSKAKEVQASASKIHSVHSWISTCQHE